MSAVTARCGTRARSRAGALHSDLPSPLFNMGHLICRIPDIFRPVESIVDGLVAKRGALIGSLAQKRTLAERQIGRNARLRTASSNWYRRSLADVRHGSQATEVQAKSWESEGVMPLGTGLTINLETTHQRLGKSVYETLWVEQYCFHPIATSVTSWFA